MTYLDKYPHCKGCPVHKYCGTMVQSTRLCKSLATPEDIEEEYNALLEAGAMDLEDLNY